MRHTFASFAIAAGIATFEIARMMGTSVEQIEKTYGHLLPDALDRGRAALEAFDTASSRGVWARNGRTRLRLGLLRLTPKHQFLQPLLHIGAPRFELGTSSPPDWRANQAAPRPAERPV